MADCVGRQLGKYHLVRILGKGGFGDVYLGEHVEDGTQAAIKVLHEPLTNENIKEFVNEAGSGRVLRHESIVRLLDIGIGDEHIAFLVMEYAPNGSLADRYPRGTQLTLDTIISYVIPISAALQYAHNKGFIHRDVKPANFLIGTNGKVLLGDFGIAAIALSTRSREQRDEEQKLAGSWVYASPEQFIGKAVRASDQYSLAVVVYEWLCGSPPFIADAPTPKEQFLQLGYQHIQVPPPPLHEKMSIAPAVEQVIMRALAKKPEQRFESIQAFARTLEQAYLGQTVLTSPLPRTAPQAPEEPILQAPPNDQRRNSFEQLWAEVMQAQVRGDSQRAFRLLLEILRMKNLSPSQRDLVKSEIRSSRQMIQWCIRRARKASYQGNWQAEIQLWEDLLALDTSQQENTEQLTLSPTWSRDSAIRERLGIAQQNKQYAWMYTLAQQFSSKQDNAAASKQLETLWRQAPFYGDPEGLAQIVGLAPADNYEQALAKKLALEQQQREEAERKRQQEEAERKRQEIKLEQDKKRRAIAAEISAGTGVGCLAGMLLDPLVWIWESYAPQGTPERTVIGHSVVSGLELFLSINFLGWVAGIIAGVLVGLTVGAVVGWIESIVNPDYFFKGRIAGGIVGFFAGLVILGTIGGLIGGDVVAAIGLFVGAYMGIYGGAGIGDSIQRLAEGLS